LARPRCPRAQRSAILARSYFAKAPLMFMKSCPSGVASVKAGAQRRRIQGQGPWGAFPLLPAPGPPRPPARLDAQGLARSPALGRRLGAALTPLLTHGVFCAVPPRGPAHPDGGQRPGARQHPPQGQDRGLGLGHLGQGGADERGPCRDTRGARPRGPPWGEGINALSHTMPPGGRSGHLFEAVRPSCIKNLPQKALGSARPSQPSIARGC
jgi:hypothetical protein